MKKVLAAFICASVFASALTGCAGSGSSGGDESKATADSATSQTEPVKADVGRVAREIRFAKR